jgi:hypothetical protein
MASRPSRMRFYGQNGKQFLTKDPKLILNDHNAGKPEGIPRLQSAGTSSSRQVQRCIAEGLVDASAFTVNTS